MGNYGRLLNGELFPQEESLEHRELVARLDKEAEMYYAELLEWADALKEEHN